MKRQSLGARHGLRSFASANRVTAQSARAEAPVDLTGYWVSVVTEDWPWRMHTPAKGDYASIPLNAEGRRVADLWTDAQDGSCLAFGAAAVLRMPTRVHITWADDSTLKIETDNGAQTRLFHFDRGGGEREPRRGRCRARRSPNGSTRKSCERAAQRAVKRAHESTAARGRRSRSRRRI